MSFVKQYEEFVNEAYSLGNGNINVTDIDFRNFENILLNSRESFNRLNEGKRIIDSFSFISELNESLKNLSESQLWDLENEFWESVIECVQESVTNEGFWSGVVKVTKQAAQQLGNSAQQVWVKIVSGVSKFIKSAIDAGREALKKIILFGKNLSKQIYDFIKDEAEERAEGIRKYSKEEVQKDINNWQSTVDWIVGKGIESASETSTKAGESAVSKLAQEDSDEKENLLDRIKNADDLIESGNDNAIYKSLTIKIVNELRKKSLLPGNETLLEDLVEYSLELVNEAENPLSDIESDVENKILNNKGTNFSKILKFCVEVVLLGPGRIAEELLTILFKGGLKLYSKTVKALGGPGVFEFATVAGILAFIITLAFDALADFGDQLALGETIKKIAHFAHDAHAYSALGKGIKGAEKVLGVAAHHAAGHSKEYIADSLPFASTIIRLIAISIAASIGIKHLMDTAYKEDKSNENFNTLLFDNFLREGLNTKY